MVRTRRVERVTGGLSGPPVGLSQASRELTFEACRKFSDVVRSTQVELS